MALTGLLIAAGLAAAKNVAVDQPAADRKRKYEAATAAYSPWTGMKSQYVQDPNIVGDMLSYGGAGAAIGSGIAKDAASANLDNAVSKNPAVNGDIFRGQNSIGGMDMSSQLGGQAKDFSAGMAKTTGDETLKQPAANSAWFFGSDPSRYSQPSLSSPELGQNYGQKYKSILNAGMSPTNPEDQWSINPFKAGLWGQPGGGR